MFNLPIHVHVYIGSLDIAVKFVSNLISFLNNFVIKQVKDSFTEHLLFFILIL